ncbi:MAG: VanZ family protein [Planctomyces sp.]|nr:VanZ family protein [Planctomyces sp.]
MSTSGKLASRRRPHAQPSSAPLDGAGSAVDPGEAPIVQSSRGQRLLRIATALYALGLTWLLVAPEPLFFLGKTGAAIDSAISSTVADWLEHACVYIVFAALLLITYGRERGIIRMLSLAAAHGIATETIQHWVPGRDATLHDLAANLSGIATGALVVAVGWTFAGCRGLTADASGASRRGCSPAPPASSILPGRRP